MDLSYPGSLLWIILHRKEPLRPNLTGLFLKQKPDLVLRRQALKRSTHRKAKPLTQTSFRVRQGFCRTRVGNPESAVP
jgi:hypothetical protein